MAAPAAAPPSRSAALWAQALCAGAVGGLGMALIDDVRALPQLDRFLPAGSLPLWAFLSALYAAAAAIAAGLIGAVMQLLLAFTPLGALRDPAGRAPVVPLWATVAAAIPVAAGFGAVLYGPTLQAQLRFHHPGLIAALLGAVALLLVLPALALHQLLLAGLLRVARPRLQAAAPTDWPLRLTGWLAAAYALAAAVALVLRGLQRRPRMTPALRALNLALWSPALALAALGLGLLLGRALLASPLRRAPRSTQLALPLLVMLAPLALALPAYDTLKLLDLRPFTTLLGGVLCAAAALPLLQRAGRARGIVSLAWLLLPLALWGAALLQGRSDRVRKAALSLAPLAGPLCGGLQAVFDLDRDGAPSRFVIGGSDCDDLDPQVHPGAFDWPDDGIDQDCNGHQATLRDPQPRPPWPAPPAALPAGANLLLITIDALRADHVGAYGYPRATTPALDALARQGYLFRQAYAHAPSTRYSVPAILTGRYPSTIAWGPPAQHWPPEVLPENRLLSEMLRGRGYRTTGLLSYHYFEPTWGLARGFDDYDVHLMHLHSLGGDPAATSGSSARELADLTITKLEALAGGPAPFFLWVHFYDPHYRYEVHPGVPLFGDGRSEQDQYDNEIRYTDDHIARVLTALQRLALWQRTVVAVTADHGEGFGEHGIPRDRRHGYHLYADQTKVPLILRLPGLDRAEGQGPRVIDEPVGHVDLLPTLLNLLGAREGDEPQLLGRSLVPLLLPDARPAAPPYRVFQEVMYEGPTTRKALVATAEGRLWHYVRNVIPDDTSELYDLQADPREERDQQGSPSARAAEGTLAQTLSAWMDQSALPRDFAARVAGNLSQRPLPARAPLQARIGDWLDVTGVDVPATLQRGVAAELALVLHSRARVPQGFRLFYHLSGPGGMFLNLDHEPLSGLLPLQLLRPGQHLRDVFPVTVPSGFPSGRYQLKVGLFRRGERAAVSGPRSDPAQKAILAAELEVR